MNTTNDLAQRIREEHDACGVGFIADLGGGASHLILKRALEAAAAMCHRGARAADGRTGDGAGILCETPRAFLARELAAAGIRATAGHLAAIGLFLPRDLEFAAAIRAKVESTVRTADVVPLRWRVPPTDDRALGAHAARTKPSFEQLIVDMGPGNVRERMRVARRAIQAALRDDAPHVTLVSASATSVVYKALLSSDELGTYFGDLRDPIFMSRFAIFHQRYSTNTSPQWRLVQPFRHIAHNGEINTITGNRAWLRARGVRMAKGVSDSFDFDTAVDSMLGSGYRVDDAVDLLLAPAIDARDERLKAYYDAHLPTVEPWDGPAAMMFYDGDVIGAALDRNGFRPLRWCRTQSGVVLAASETGVVDFGSDPIVKRGRLGPGQRLVVRFASHELVEPEAFRAERRNRADFRFVVSSWQFDMQTDEASPSTPPDISTLDTQMRRFGYSREDEKDVIGVMASGAGEPITSMGDDAAPAFLQRRAPVASYLRQRFAQVTNPPIDPLREALVFDMRAFVGSGDIHGDVPAAGSIVAVDSAILSEGQFDSLRQDARLVQYEIDLILDESSLESRLRKICDDAERAVRDGASLIVLDDRKDGAVVPAVLAAGALHQRLTQEGLRMQASIAVADGFSKDSHSIAAGIGAGANVVTPWLALRVAERAGTQKAVLGTLRLGLLKIMSKLGVCTMRSYVGAQTFESLGLGHDVSQLCFPGMVAHVPTVRFTDFEEELRTYYEESKTQSGTLPDRGSFRYRREGARRAFDPNVIKTLRSSAMRGDYEAFEKLSDTMDEREPVAVRDLLQPIALGPAIALEEVESEQAILRRFVTAAMSLGAIGPEAHETIARAMNRIGARSNSGEGGEEPRRFARTAESGRSAIKQVASARFGVGVTYLASADEIEIKMAQGSKPGEGGQIPGHKVTEDIARLRGAQPGQPLISPPPHHDIYSIEDLAQLIYDLHRAAPHAKIAVKLVSQSGIGTVASGVAKGMAEVIHISGHDGGTGASPLASVKYAGLPWELGLTETHHALLFNGLRPRVALRVDGGLKNGRDVIIGSMLGADQFGFGSALLVALGCIYARQCHKNTCPVGIATQDPELRKKFAGTPENAIAYLEFIAKDVRRRLARLGARSLDEVHGRSDLLRARRFPEGAYSGVDLNELLRLPEVSMLEAGVAPEPAHLDDAVTLPWSNDVVSEAGILPISPGDRAVGARIAHAYAARRSGGDIAAPISVTYSGSAGQSFGAFLTDGIEFILNGDANDYVGKGMEGGRIIVRGFGETHEPVVGNTCFYGARGGESYILGAGGERFGVRNSGARLVVEGAGDHACEYMTAGAVVILGPLGRNVASGMSGGRLFLYDELGERVVLGPTEFSLARMDEHDPDLALLRELLEAHRDATGSERAMLLLQSWPSAAARFLKLAPAAAERSVITERSEPVSRR